MKSLYSCPNKKLILKQVKICNLSKRDFRIIKGGIAIQLGTPTNGPRTVYSCGVCTTDVTTTC